MPSLMYAEYHKLVLYADCRYVECSNVVFLTAEGCGAGSIAYHGREVQP
jgi:hypothetical protein